MKNVNLEAHPAHPGLKVPQAAQSDSARSQNESNAHADHSHAFSWRELNRVLFVTAAAGAIWFLHGHSTALTALGVACALVGGFPIYHEAYENIVQRRMTMELSMAIAIIAALAIREVFTALIITDFVLASEILEGLTVGRGRRAIQSLIDLLPHSAAVRRNSEWTDVPISELSTGAEVLVRPGARIPVDGSVVRGHSFVDQAPITGESMPVEKNTGAVVYAGTINQSGALEIRVDHVGLNTAFGKIVEAVERAEKSRAPIQRIADRLAGYLVYFALAAAALTFLLTHNMRSTISVVIVAGACGIAAGTPLAILGGIGRAAQHGVIIKGGLYLEKLAEVDTILLDKTGTLTYGRPEVTNVAPAEGVSAKDLLEFAAIAEIQSEHPLAKAIVNKAVAAGIHPPQPDQFDYAPGRGITARVDGDEILVGSSRHLQDHHIRDSNSLRDTSNGAVWVAKSGKLLGSITVADNIRPEAKSAIQSLKSMKFEIALVTGDAKPIAESVGRGLAVDEVFADLLPGQKRDCVQDLQSQGRKIAMVGDGINDAPALSEATVGVAMGSGTDVARESADVVLIGSDLTKLVQAIRVARRCHFIIMENFVGTLVVDTVGIILAAFGYLNPLLAAFIHVSSEMAFILNSARLLPHQSR
jgi:heavy metal translocating P-type ATPase